MKKYCACCKGMMNGVEGVSSIYSHETFILCEECWLEEERIIDETGTNVHPEIIQHYQD